MSDELASRMLFTAPWEPVAVRRGDALGLRAFADLLAEAVAPDFSNGTRDARWVTILSWCLVRSHAVFHASGGRSTGTRAEQGARYAWLRPLELMWVARTLAVTESGQGRQLAGRRSVEKWCKGQRRSDRFEMSVDQFRAYRQIGMYGRYRLAFRKWPGLTLDGDGWTPGPKAIELARWLDARLGVARPGWPLDVGSSDAQTLSLKSAKRSRDSEYGWWIRKWRAFDRSGRNADANTLPSRQNDFAALPETNLLSPVVFGLDPNGRRRRNVARQIARASATDHLGLCEHLARVFSDDQAVAVLPRFSRLGDAGMDLMDFVARDVRRRGRSPLKSLAEDREAGELSQRVVTAAKAWVDGGDVRLRHIESVHAFAEAIPKAEGTSCLRAVLEYHEAHGGGLRWFALRNDVVEPRTPLMGGSARYRFRLWPLCRLAAQCGVIRGMPAALRSDVDGTEPDSGEDSDE